MLRGNLTPGGTFHLDTAEMPMAVQGLPDASKQSATKKRRKKKKKKKGNPRNNKDDSGKRRQLGQMFT